MDNFNLVLENYVIQWESVNSAMKENEVRLGSMRTKMTQLGASFDKLAVSAGDAGLLGIAKDLTDGLREVVDELVGVQSKEAYTAKIDELS